MEKEKDWLGKDRMVEDVNTVTEEPEEEPMSKSLKTGLSFVLEKKKFPVVKMDVADIEEITFPNDFTALSDDELTKLMGLYTQLIGYAKFEVAKADVERTAKQNKYNWKKAKKSVEFREKQYSQDDLKMRIEADVELNNLKKEYEIENAKYKLIDALLYSYGQNYKVLSRELTKRGLYKE